MKYKLHPKGNITEWKGVVSIMANSKSNEKLHQSQQTFIIYGSGARYSCSKLCNWGFRTGEEFEKKLLQYEKEGQYSKATALAVFHFNLKRALATLRKISSNDSMMKGKLLFCELINCRFSEWYELFPYRNGFIWI